MSHYIFALASTKIDIILMLINFVTKLQSTSRNYLQRMMNEKVNCMKIAKNMEKIIGMETENLGMVDTNIFQEDGLM